MNKLTGVLLSTAVCASLASADKVVQKFEAPKDTSAFTEVEWDWNADLTFNYQGLDQDYELASDSSTNDIKAGLSLPTANLDINAKVMSGFNVKLETMLSSHHHNESYVKGGYATADNLDFVAPGFLDGFMKYATVKIGVDDINFGDAHFRRTDNADVFKNPFIHNMAVEAYMQAAFLEVLYRIPTSNMFVLGGITNGQANPDDVTDGEGKDAYGFYAKAGWDTQISDSTRVRLSQSIFFIDDTSKSRLYSADKAGTVSREVFGKDNDFGSAYYPFDKSYTELSVYMTNLFVKYEDTELFGLFEYADGAADADNQSMLHYSIDLVQRFGNDKYYVAARYENATVEKDSLSEDEELTQYQIGLGWFLSKNAMAKLEYIKQERENMSEYTNGKAEFDGFMVSTALSF